MKCPEHPKASFIPHPEALVAYQTRSTNKANHRVISALSFYVCLGLNLQYLIVILA